jgi:hypothetical protein
MVQNPIKTMFQVWKIGDDFCEAGGGDDDSNPLPHRSEGPFEGPTMYPDLATAKTTSSP